MSQNNSQDQNFMLISWPEKPLGGKDGLDEYPDQQQGERAEDQR